MKKIIILCLGVLCFSKDPQLINMSMTNNFSSAQEDTISQFSNLYKTDVEIKIALLMPKKIIGRYSVATIDTILSYIMARGNNFVFEVFDSGDESFESIKKTYEKIQDSKYDSVIAILTIDGTKELLKNDDIDIPIYIPTINKVQLGDIEYPKNVFFGGIDYDEQISMLLELVGETQIVAYNDNSLMGDKLKQLLTQKANVIYQESITSESAATFSKRIEEQENYIKGNAIFLNTPVIKTGLILSQLGYSKSKPAKFLSTQINYSPSLLLLTQQRDRDNLFVANAINQTDQKLIEYSSLFNSDIQYDWVNYSTAIGVEFFFRKKMPDSQKYFREEIKDNQVVYKNKIYKIDSQGFYEYIN